MSPAAITINSSAQITSIIVTISALQEHRPTAVDNTTMPISHTITAEISTTATRCLKIQEEANAQASQWLPVYS